MVEKINIPPDLMAQWEEKLREANLANMDTAEGFSALEDEEPEVQEMIETYADMTRDSKGTKIHEYAGMPETVESLVESIRGLQLRHEADRVQLKTSTNCKSPRFGSYDSIVLIFEDPNQKYFYHFPTKRLHGYDRMATIDEVSRQTEIPFAGHFTTEMRATDG